MPFFGAHMSVAGGLEKAFERIAEADGEALQIFTRNQRQWRAAPVAEDEARAFRDAWRRWGYPHVAAHGSYLLNPASPDPDMIERTVEALAAEIARCRDLGIGLAVIHPGSHKGAGERAGCRAVARTLDAALDRAGTDAVAILLENTAGQGDQLGARFEHVAEVLEHCRRPELIGVCLDTCHAYAAGHRLSRPHTLDRLLARMHALFGLDRLRLVHANDSMFPFASRRDRHQHIGKGRMGLAPFRALANHPALASLPFVIETPKGKGPENDRRNLALLKSLVLAPGGEKGKPGRASGINH